MVYEDTFYTMDNIIAYSGNPNILPTVYFRQGNRFGHITQAHDNPTHVGRSLVREFDDYRLYNNHNGMAEEFYDGAVRSIGQGPLFTIAGAANDWLPFLLSTSLLNCTCLKIKDT
ncbi:hypothetical protein [Vibrio ouci]|uniref:Uncharacterized protein n=1 Tax=Vibrio ouci TaxID=2499078 RepID=A0A4Y8W9M6_9VIBR|nr:hypothetical protein [Vibrio ouci]TFH89494.1 hypothetical protein ELS82_21965 [Vibrio ouci]